MSQAAETEEIDNEVEEQVEELETEQPEEGAEESGDETQAEDDSVVISIGDESPSSEEAEEQRAPEWVRDLRKSNRETVRELKEAKAELERLKTPQKAPISEKPTLEGCDYDSDDFERELTAWHDRKREADAEARKKEEEQANAQKAWQAKLDDYGKLKSELKVKDYEDAEAAATELLSTTQQGVILSGAENPAMVVYALGKNPKKAKELASITDPVKFAFAVAKLETQLKVTPRKSAPLPESTVRGSARTPGNTDAQLARLRDEAQRTGDASKVLAYKSQLKARSK